MMEIYVVLEDGNPCTVSIQTCKLRTSKPRRPLEYLIKDQT